MKCCFCGAELQTHTMTPGRTFICVNKGCPVDSVVMKRIVWQALIDGKKAQDALKVALDGLNELADPTLTDANYRDSVLTQFGLNRAVNHIKDKITSIIKQGNE